MPDLWFFLLALLLPLIGASLAAFCIILDARWRQGLLWACSAWIPCLGIILWQSNGGTAPVVWNAHTLPGIAVLPLALGGLCAVALSYLPTRHHIFFIVSGIAGSALFALCLYRMLAISDHAFTQFPLCLGCGLLFIWGIHAGPSACFRAAQNEDDADTTAATYMDEARVLAHLFLIPALLAPCILFTGNSSFAMAIGCTIAPILAISTLLLWKQHLTAPRQMLLFIALPLALIVSRCILEESVTWVSLLLIGCAPWAMQLMRINTPKKKTLLVLSIGVAIAVYSAAIIPIASAYFAEEDTSTQGSYDYSF